MRPPHDPPPRGGTFARRLLRVALKLLFGLLLPVAVLLVSGLMAARLMQTAPEAERGGPRKREGRLVETLTLHAVDRTVTVHAQGVVVPARRVTLFPQVSGKLQYVDDALIPGARIREGQKLFAIDDRDYQLAVRQRLAELQQAQSALKLEEGQQQIARQEYELLGEQLDEEDAAWVLRRPQLENAQAAISLAEAALDAARLQLARTEITAPFDSIVLQKHVDRGTMVGPSTPLVELAGTQQFWVELSVPLDDLRWIRMPGPDGQPGAEVRLFQELTWDPARFRMGRVIRLAGEINPASRLARLIVAVDDPLALAAEHDGEPPLLLNSYVTAEIAGQPLQNVIPISREFVRNGEYAWIMDEAGLLQIRLLDIAFRGKEEVLVTGGVRDGEQLVTTKLDSPVQGMLLRTREQHPEAAPAAEPLRPAVQDAADE
ncbi:MAG TPA: efflux RND transporter periplasmic adaptor subunit [Candidatus Sumerlaeota bacterium]|nr:efflux RND transporter periplasmic adaptor subunit [Candidatus Sumerlaeota bacterium]